MISPSSAGGGFGPWEEFVDFDSFGVGHFEVDCFTKVVGEIVAECNSGVNVLDKSQCGNFERFRLIVADVDFVLEHMIHELGVLKLEVGELEVGDHGVADKDFPGIIWFLLDRVVKLIVVVFFVGWELD